MKKELKIILIILSFIVLFAIGRGVLLLLVSKPDSDELLAYVKKAYGKDFQVIEEFTYISYTDGEWDTQRELKCPAVELQDKENSDIRFIAYAYPMEGGDWIYRDNYSGKVLLYCMKQEKLMIINEDECDAVTSFVNPCLSLDNTDETAQKLQNVVIQFNEFHQYDDQYAYSNERFEVEGSSFVYQIIAGNTSDRWLEETGPFCYDTPIEKYKTFLEKLEDDSE